MITRGGWAYLIGGLIALAGSFLAYGSTEKMEFGPEGITVKDIFSKKVYKWQEVKSVHTAQIARTYQTDESIEILLKNHTGNMAEDTITIFSEELAWESESGEIVIIMNEYREKYGEIVL